MKVAIVGVSGAVNAVPEQPILSAVNRSRSNSYNTTMTLKE